MPDLAAPHLVRLSLVVVYPTWVSMPTQPPFWLGGLILHSVSLSLELGMVTQSSSLVS